MLVVDGVGMSDLDAISRRRNVLGPSGSQIILPEADGDDPGALLIRAVVQNSRSPSSSNWTSQPKPARSSLLSSQVCVRRSFLSRQTSSSRVGVIGAIVR
jgi:hypothetical protein